MNAKTVAVPKAKIKEIRAKLGELLQTLKDMRAILKGEKVE